MTWIFLRLVILSMAGSVLVPTVTAIASRILSGSAPSAGEVGGYVAGLAVAGAATLLLASGLRRFHDRIDNLFDAQAAFLDTLPTRYVSLAIFGSAALSLFLELTVIRWQGTVFEFFAFYKNFSLLACFAGLGLGYALARRARIALPAVMPLLVWQLLFLIGFRFGMSTRSLLSVSGAPVSEQLNMGMAISTTLTETVATYFFLAVVFVLTALAFVPIGQACGRLMTRHNTLRAYGLNLLGSLAGIALSFAVAFLWTPPIVWYALAFAAVLLLHVRRTTSVMVACVLAVAGLAVLAWPVSPLWSRIYSPYQLLELGHTGKGLMEIRAAGQYYQRVHDLTRVDESDPAGVAVRNYYDLPYRVHGTPNAVAIVGAGTGNDVAAAVRAKAEVIDAIEIDPAILAAGRANHPEHPYSQPNVRPIVNDARTFLRTADRGYDVIVYGLLDSHTLLSHASSVRLDSFVYTVEGLQDARAHLAPGGILALSFTVLSDEMGRKIHLMLQEAFQGRAPYCVEAKYDRSFTFLQAEAGRVEIPPGVLEQSGFAECATRFSDAAIEADVSTDDWPFFYMSRRTYPVSYVVMIAVVLALSLFLITRFGERGSPRHVPYFLLGSGFMLVETKGITEMGLTFGNTWQVIGIVISGILVMAFLANWTVQRLNVRRPLVPYLLLLTSLGVGLIVAMRGGLSPTFEGRIATAILLTSPLFFSGIVFSSLLATDGEVPGAMAANLFGGMVGGLLEYNAMYFGFQFLYVLAAALYAGAFASSILQAKKLSPVLT